METFLVHSKHLPTFEKEVNRHIRFRRQLVLLSQTTRKFRGKDFTVYIAVFSKRR